MHSSFLLPFPALLLPVLMAASLAGCNGITRVTPTTSPAPTGTTETALTAAAPASALSSQIDAIQTQITKRRGYNGELREAIEGYENRLPKILSQDRAQGPSVQEFDFRTSVQGRIGEADRAAKSWQETINAHSAVVNKAEADPRHGELQTAINELTEIRADLLRQRARLAGLLDKLK